MAQVNCDCDDLNYVVDTVEVIKSIRSRYAYLTVLEEAEFEYIYKKSYDDGCNEPDEVTEHTYYLKNQVVMKSKYVLGSGEGGVISSSSSIKYYENEQLIFEFIVRNEEYMNAPGDNSREEIRVYYNQCRTMVRRLSRAITVQELKEGQTLEEAILEVPQTFESIH